MNKALSDACELTLKQSSQRKKLVLMTDAGFRSAGIGLIIMDNTIQNTNQSGKRTSPWCLYQNLLTCANQDVHILTTV